MNSEERYARNLELFARDNPLEAYRLENDNPAIKFCYTSDQELNLIDETTGMSYYFPEGAMLEAKEWAKGLKIDQIDVIFVYGLGLGYYYFPLTRWLSENSGRYLVFLEDSPTVIEHFLQTEQATEILEDRQVMVKLIPKINPDEEGWAQLRLAAADLFQSFAFAKPYITGLQTYFFNRFEFFHAFSLQWLTALSRAARSLTEFYPMTPLIFQNFYANILYLGEAIPGYRLANTMKSIPAILCGAGPSLDKQLPLLKTVLDQALIIASGSAMNAVTQAEITPHCGGAIDPTEVQAGRQLTSFAFDVPVFYQNRFNHIAFKQLHGPKIFMTGSGSYRISEWFEKELGIEDAPQLIMGVSTSNFLLEVANFLGCNPILLIGMDLAYKNDQRYASGISTHPSDKTINQDELNQKLGPLQAVPGVDRKTVYTTHQWYYEAICFGAFKQRNPEVILINATEGGMAIPEVPNESFTQVLEEHCKSSWDIEGWFHGTLQNAARDKISSEKVLKAISKWKSSLEACSKLLSQLIDEMQQKLASVKKQQVFPYVIHEGKLAFWQHELQQEPAYEFLLDTLNTVFNTLISLRRRNLNWIADENHLRIEKFAIEFERYRFFKTYVDDHLQSIAQGIFEKDQWQHALAKKTPQEVDFETSLGEYKIEAGVLTIEESELELKQTTNFNPHLIPKESWPKQGQQIEAMVGMVQEIKEGQTLYFYPDGSLKVEAFYKAGKLHGPWRFYSSEGKKLYHSWFIEGKRAGKCCAYYLEGALYSVLGYVDGLQEGRQLHYYPDGTLKTIEIYKKGVLNGVVRVYYGNGQMQKEQHFVDGKLEGRERVWNVQGELEIDIVHHGQ